MTKKNRKPTDFWSFFRSPIGLFKFAYLRNDHLFFGNFCNDFETISPENDKRTMKNASQLKSIILVYVIFAVLRCTLIMEKSILSKLNFI